jgi:hypothetical protein
VVAAAVLAASRLTPSAMNKAMVARRFGWDS